jgi:threonine dehydrogenase-like Zn-dependent dehydrogenase
MKMKAAVVVGPARMEIQEIEMPALSPTQMRVRITACGLCHSELGRYLGTGTMWTGQPLSYPMMLGHEPAGVVTEVGSAVRGFAPGDRVTGLGIRKSFAEYATVDFASQEFFTEVVKVPETLPLELCIGEPLKCCVSIVRYSQIKFGDHAFVAGCGFMGLVVIANLASRGLGEIIACDVLDDRLEMAKTMGATATVNPRRADVVREVKSLTRGRMCDVAFEGIGKPVGVTLTSQVIRTGPPPGVVVLYGYHAVPEVYDLSLWGPRAPVILSLHPEYSPDQRRDMEIAMQAVAGGHYPLDKLISHRFRLEETEKGFQALVNPPVGYLKGIVTP